MQWRVRCLKFSCAAVLFFFFWSQIIPLRITSVHKAVDCCIGSFLWLSYSPPLLCGHWHNNNVTEQHLLRAYYVCCTPHILYEIDITLSPSHRWARWDIERSYNTFKVTQRGAGLDLNTGRWALPSQFRGEAHSHGNQGDEKSTCPHPRLLTDLHRTLNISFKTAFATGARDELRHLVPHPARGAR